MQLKQNLLEDLNRLKYIVSALDDLQFVKSLPVLSGSSIGQHVRHIVEFYLTLTEKPDATVISYDNRKRDHKIETDRHRCLEVLHALAIRLGSLDEAKALMVAANYDEKQSESIYHASTISRELGYVLEHSIHHQAIIKIGLSELGQHLNINIGVAPATVRHQKYS